MSFGLETGPEKTSRRFFKTLRRFGQNVKAFYLKHQGVFGKRIPEGEYGVRECGNLIILIQYGKHH